MQRLISHSQTSIAIGLIHTYLLRFVGFVVGCDDGLAVGYKLPQVGLDVGFDVGLLEGLLSKSNTTHVKVACASFILNHGKRI